MFDVSMDWSNGLMSGTRFETSRRTLKDLAVFFADQQAVSALASDTPLYEVQSYQPVKEGTEGGLFWGNTTLYPGTVGEEYYMTKGHFHHIDNRAEYYVTCKGTGSLLLMESDGPTGAEAMSTGSVHYIPGGYAHRVANTGTEPLVFIACWPSDAGYDYERIEKFGFSARLLKKNGLPTLVPRG